MSRDALFELIVEAGSGPGVSYTQPWRSEEPFPEVFVLPAAHDWRFEFDGALPRAELRVSFPIAGVTANAGFQVQLAAPNMPLEVAVSGCSLRVPGTPPNPFGLAGSDAAALEYRSEPGPLPFTMRFSRRADTYGVRIPIIDAHSEAPIVGAELVLMGYPSIGVVRSAADGVATFRCDAPVGHVLFVRAPEGYVDVSFPDELGFTRSEDGADVDLPAFGLVREGLITGRIVDA